MHRRTLLILPAVAAFVAIAAPLQAADWPSRPVTVVVPFAAGGNTDMMARLGAQHLSAKFGQSFVVENRPSAGGALGTGVVAAATPDGYTLLYGSSATLGIAPALYKNVEYDPIRSFAPVALVSRVPFVLGVAAGVPHRPEPEGEAVLGAGNEVHWGHQSRD